MSRFRPRISALGNALIPAGPLTASPARPPSVQFNPPATVSAPVVGPAEPTVSIGQRIGLWVLAAYMISGILNEWMVRVAGTKAYLSLIALVALPVVWLASGAALRGLGHPIGRYWAAFVLLLVIDTPFSIWRGGSFALLMDYVPRNYLMFFYAAAVCVSLRDCRRLMYFSMATSLGALLTCASFGRVSDDGRYFVPGGLGFFQNSNELALQLLLGITQFVYLFSQKGVLRKIVSVAGIVGSVPFIFRTGSRGCVIAAAAYCALFVYTSRHRIRVAAIIAGLLIAGALLAPSAALHRILLLTDESHAASSDTSAILSEMSRIDLLKRSISETIRHPLFGVGPGQFPVAIFEEAKAKGEWTQWLGTHNAYTEVSSECGLPALGCYMAVIFFCFSLNVRVWKASRDLPNGADWSNLAIALLSATTVYAVGSFFFHMAYSGALPFLGGQTLALYFAAKQRLQLGERGLSSAGK